MMGMPARRNSPNQPQRPEPSVLKVPQSDAEAALDARIAGGRQLVDAEAAELASAIQR
jgi:hypothetical protein